MYKKQLLRSRLLKGECKFNGKWQSLAKLNIIKVDSVITNAISDTIITQAEGSELRSKYVAIKELI